MLESQKFRQHAKDCIRLADGMSAKDRHTLLEIADAWEIRAAEVEKKERQSVDGGKDPQSPAP